MTRVLYTGSFDPITKGHMALIEEASGLFDEIIIAVMNNSSKTHMFTQEERKKLISDIYKDYTNIKVVMYEGASIDAALDYECNAILRGIRNTTDYEYEKINASVNKEISNGRIKTICLLSRPEYECFSSTIVKEVFRLGKDISSYVPLNVKIAMEKKRVK